MPKADHIKYMRAALDKAHLALANKEFPVGCVIVEQGKIIAHGQRANSHGDNLNELDHAEIVALRDLIDNHPEVDPGTVTIYSTMEPCLMCFATLILNGIRRIVYGYEDAMGGGSDLDLAKLRPLYSGMQIDIMPHILRKESLALFKQFFQDPANDYWHGSLLADYTLSQK